MSRLRIKECERKVKVIKVRALEKGERREEYEVQLRNKWRK